MYKNKTELCQSHKQRATCVKIVLQFLCKQKYDIFTNYLSCKMQVYAFIVIQKNIFVFCKRKVTKL